MDSWSGDNNIITLLCQNNLCAFDHVLLRHLHYIICKHVYQIVYPLITYHTLQPISKRMMSMHMFKTCYSIKASFSSHAVQNPTMSVKACKKYWRVMGKNIGGGGKYVGGGE